MFTRIKTNTMQEKIKNISQLSVEVLKNRIQYMREKTREYLSDTTNLHVFIAKGNEKTGQLVPSVSIRPMLDCKNCAKCGRLCYDMRFDCMFKNVMNTRCKNYAIWKNEPKRYFDEISKFCSNQYAFRWHVGGDIVNEQYFDGVVRVAKQNKHCKFLIFTKRFELVNEYASKHRIPKNLQIIFSGWVGQEMNNPNNFPTSHPIFADGQTTAHDGAKWCGGNCTKCLLKKCGCWKLKKGEEVIFKAH